MSCIDTFLTKFFDTQFLTHNCHVLTLSSQNYIHTQKNLKLVLNTQLLTLNCHALTLFSQNYIHTQKKITTQMMTLNWLKMTPLVIIF